MKFRRLSIAAPIENFLVRLLVLGLAVSATSCTHNSTSWHDPSKHRLQFVTVEDGIRLEVLDWGGSGRPVVLLAGSGNTAHVFDGFAEKVTGLNHVYGITRRGYGASSRPASGFSAQRLADDVLNVLDSLHLASPVLVGHSLGGQELTALASSHPNRIVGLVYLDSAADPTFNWSPYQELRKKLPVAMNVTVPPAAAYKSFQAYRDWQESNGESSSPNLSCAIASPPSLTEVWAVTLLQPAWATRSSPACSSPTTHASGCLYLRFTRFLRL